MKIIIRSIEYNSVWEFLEGCIFFMLIMVGYYLYMGMVLLGEAILYIIGRSPKL